MNREAVVTICFGFPALIKKRIGLKKIPPPIPTTPEIKPNIPPIKTETITGIFLKTSSFSSNDLNLNNNYIPAIIKTTHNMTSKKSFYIGKDPPIKASGIDPNRYGINNFKLRFPALI